MPHILPWNDQAVRKYSVSEGISVSPPSTAKTDMCSCQPFELVVDGAVSFLGDSGTVLALPHRNDEKVEIYLPGEISLFPSSFLPF